MITEAFGAEGLMGLASELNVPVVGVSTMRTNPWVQSMTGTPIPSSFVPFVLSQLPREMNFCHRVQNTFQYLICLRALRVSFLTKLMKKHTTKFGQMQNYLSANKEAIFLWF